jgi:hypothetical protein
MLPRRPTIDDLEGFLYHRIYTEKVPPNSP